MDLHKLTRRRAQEIYIRNGRVPGRDRINGAQPEEEIRAEFEPASRPTAIVIRGSGVRYVGEYTHEAGDGYAPGKFKPAAPVPVRLDGDRMLVERPHGKVLETKIARPIG